MNNTRVIPARINLNKDSGGRIEILFNRKINQDSIEVIFFSSRKPDSEITFTSRITVGDCKNVLSQFLENLLPA